jgi:molybdopterin converting factor small subunit
MPRLELPSLLRPLAEGRGALDCPGATVGAVVTAACARYPALQGALFDGRGQLKRHVSLFVGDDDVRDLQGLETPLAPGAVVLLVAAISGG